MVLLRQECKSNLFAFLIPRGLHFSLPLLIVFLVMVCRLLLMLIAAWYSMGLYAAPAAVDSGQPGFDYTMPEDPSGVAFFDGLQLGVTTLSDFEKKVVGQGGTVERTAVQLPSPAAQVFHREIRVEAKGYLSHFVLPRRPVTAFFLDNRLVRVDLRLADAFAFNRLLKDFRRTMGDPDEEHLAGYLREYADQRSRDYWMVFRTFYDPRTTFYIADELADKDIRPLKRKVQQEGYAPQEFYCGEAVWQNQSAVLSFACPRERREIASEATLLHRRLNDRMLALELQSVKKK